MNNRLKNFRKNHLGITQDKFGERLGVGKAAISALESGKNNISDQMIKSICREFNINEEWLRTGNGEMENLPEDEIAVIVSEFLENPDSKFYKLILELAHTYNQLSPDSQNILDNYAESFIRNIKNGESFK